MTVLQPKRGTEGEEGLPFCLTARQPAGRAEPPLTSVLVFIPSRFIVTSTRMKSLV